MNITASDIILHGKSIAAAAAGVAWAFMAPVMPYAELCTVMVLADYLSARQLGRRLSRRLAEKGRKDAAAPARFSSARFKGVIATLTRVYAALLLAAAIQNLLVEGMPFVPSGFNCVKFVAGLVCFWQLMSILENESTCSSSRWARLARRYLADKARRHLDLPADDSSGDIF